MIVVSKWAVEALEACFLRQWVGRQVTASVAAEEAEDPSGGSFGRAVQSASGAGKSFHPACEAGIRGLEVDTNLVEAHKASLEILVQAENQGLAYHIVGLEGDSIVDMAVAGIEEGLVAGNPAVLEMVVPAGCVALEDLASEEPGLLVESASDPSAAGALAPELSLASWHSIYATAC